MRDWEIPRQKRHPWVREPTKKILLYLRRWPLVGDLMSGSKHHRLLFISIRDHYIITSEISSRNDIIAVRNRWLTSITSDLTGERMMAIITAPMRLWRSFSSSQGTRGINNCLLMSVQWNHSIVLFPTRHQTGAKLINASRIIWRDRFSREPRARLHQILGPSFP